MMMSDTKRRRVHKLETDENGTRYEYHWVLCLDAERFNEPHGYSREYRYSDEWVDVTCKLCLRKR